MFRTIEQYQIDRIRQALTEGQIGANTPGSLYRLYGGLWRGVATGRARCRGCGEKIRKGVPVGKFGWDFTGSGSWTAVDCYIHADGCPSPDKL